MQQQIQLTEAVREGARVGALSGTAADMQAQVVSTVGTGASLTYPTTTVCSTTSTSAGDATITASRTYTAITPIFSLMQLFTGTGGTITLSATGVMACLG
jgi:hypothetical protein